MINEEGKITDLPPNMAATLLARHLGAIADDDWIAGSAVITGGTSNGDTAALTDAQLHHTYDQLAASFRTAAKTVATTAGN
ncbi:hypothetical protein GCM10009716_41480 [Streptomyces sodiiphilus]|uniref:DUF3846 domain-containing protein n=1 Tax=Streptomyces sodiiphilus TaxID=226217 RepID=A0ABN2PUG5_9ACTN